MVLREYLAPVLRERIDTLVLGCTHYPLLKRTIQQIVGPRIVLVDSAESCAHYVKHALKRLDLLSTRRRREGIIQPFVTDDVEHFESMAARFLDAATQPPCKVELPV